jgi:fructoselysine-6-P-deglycase FrlB-like protein
VSEIEREIVSQPACWRRAIEEAGRVRDRLPAPGARVAAVGCGTSLFIAQAYAALREAAGRGETRAFPASEAPAGTGYDAVVAISRSGTTTEVAQYVASVDGVPRIGLVGVLDSPIAAAVDRIVPLDFADERSVVQTRFATSALALLRADLGEDLEPAIAQAEAAVIADLPVDPTRFSHFVFLGRGWSVGLANEAALKLREAAQAWTESYPAMEYRHGPISVAGPGTLVWAIGDVDGSVLDDVAATGATVVGGGLLDPMVELIGIQRSAVAIAIDRGLDPDRPAHLARSVVLS